jgi:hypothetical protein
MLWAIMFVALMILGRYGVDGLRDAGVVGALIVAAFGVRSFLNAFWKARDKSKEEPEKHYWDGPGFRINRNKRGLSLSSNVRRTFSPTDGGIVSTQICTEDERSFPSRPW